MGMSLANRASVTNNQTISLIRLSIDFLKSFSTSSPLANKASSTAATTSAAKKPKRRKKKNLFEVAQFLPNWGLGFHMAKSHWTNVSYEITKINLYKDGRHGKAWGIAYKDGLPAADAPKKIGGVHKHCWRYIPSLTNSLGSKPTSPKLTETKMAPQAEVQAAFGK